MSYYLLRIAIFLFVTVIYCHAQSIQNSGKNYLFSIFHIFPFVFLLSPPTMGRLKMITLGIFSQQPVYKDTPGRVVAKDNPPEAIFSQGLCSRALCGGICGAVSDSPPAGTKKGKSAAAAPQRNWYPDQKRENK